MTTLYIVMVNDRHSDPEPFPFSTEDAAVAFARSTASELCRFGDPEEQSIAGWLFYATFSAEGDSVWVQAKQLDQRHAEDITIER